MDIERSLISVLVPAYNVEDYIKNCLNSIIRQTYKNIEILVVDDGSTDSTGEIAEMMAKEDKRIKVVHQENVGLATTRNRLLSLAAGEYIFQVDSDDYISEYALEMLYDNLKQAEADLSIGSCVSGYSTDYVFPSDISEKPVVLTGDDRYRELFGKDKLIFISAWAKLYNRKIFDGLKYPDGKIHEDEYLAHRILDRAEKIVYSSTPVLYYTVKESSITNSAFSHKRLDCVPALLDRNEFFENKGNDEILRLCYIDFLKRFQYFYYGVKYNFPEERSLADTLYGQYKDVYNKASGKRMLGLKEKILFGLFLKNTGINYLARKIFRKKDIDT